MKNYIILFTFTVLLFAKMSLCTAADYFPLEVGNVWYLEYRKDFEMNLFDKKIVIDGNEFYHLYDHDYYFRKDNSGKVYRAFFDLPDEITHSESIMYNLSANVGESWRGGKYKSSSFEYTITLESIADTVETSAGTFYNCYRFRFAAPENVYDADRIEWLAPDIGIVKLHSCWGSKYLIKALINGVKIEIDPVYPEVERTIPENGGVIDRYITIDFTWAITLNSLTAENFKLTSAKEGDLPIYFYFREEKIASHFVKIFPERPFAYDDTIYVTVSSAVEDYTGDHMQNDYFFFCVTGADTTESIVEENQPKAYSLLQNYPNPFNHTTTISFGLPEPSWASLHIYNAAGRKIVTLVDDTMSAGMHTVRFDGSNLASGMYFYRFESPGFEKKGKMLLVK